MGWGIIFKTSLASLTNLLSENSCKEWQLRGHFYGDYGYDSDAMRQGLPVLTTSKVLPEHIYYVYSSFSLQGYFVYLLSKPPSEKHCVLAMISLTLAV